MDSSFSVIVIVFLLFLCWILSKISFPKEREYGVKSITVKGEIVRSNAERIISDYLTRKNINYVYEPEVNSRTSFFQYRIGRPDFYLPDYDVYVEYWGLVDADEELTRERYVRSMKKKMAQYYQNNIKFISIYQQNMNDLDWAFRKKFKDVTGFELPN